MVLNYKIQKYVTSWKHSTIDYGEFIAAIVHLNELEREEHLAATLRYFDKDGSGYITTDELQQACKEHNMEDVLLEDVIKEVDQDDPINIPNNQEVVSIGVQTQHMKSRSVYVACVICKKIQTKRSIISRTCDNGD